MPTFTVTDPSTGQKIRLTGDSPPTEAELNEIFGAVSQAQQPAQPSLGIPPTTGVQGPVMTPEQVQQFAQTMGMTPEQTQLFAQQPMTPQQAQARALQITGGPTATERLTAEMSPVEAALVGAGRGFTTIGRGLGLVEPETEFEAQAIEQLREAQPPGVVTGGEIVGEAAPFVIPGAGLAGVGARAAQIGGAAALGAAEAGIIARGQGRDIGEQLFTAGVGGSVAGALEVGIPVIGKIGGKVIRKVTGRAPAGAVVDSAGNPSQEFVDALAESGQSFDDVIREVQEELRKKAVEPREAARQAFLQSQGLDPTQAQITRTADDFVRQQEAAKTSTAVREALEKQNAVLTTRFNNKVLETGGDATSQSAAVTDFITDKATTLDQEIGDLYRAARERLPTEENIRPQGLARKLQELIPADRRSGGNVTAIVGDMRARGLLDNEGNLVGNMNVESSEDLRQFMNTLFDEKNPFGNTVLRQVKDALDDDVFKTAGEDFFEQARAAKTAFERELSRAKISKFDSRRDNLVRDVLENKIDPDQLVDKVVFSKRWRPDDLQQLKDYISTDAAGKQAFDDMRAEVMQKITDRAFTGPIDEAGNRALNITQLRKALQSIGAKKRNILFTNEEQKFLNDMIEVAELRQPVAGTALGRGPSGLAATISRLERKARDLPAIGKAVEFFDREGRIALRGKPRRVIPPAPRLPAAAQAVVTPTAAAITAEQLQQMEQGQQ